MTGFDSSRRSSASSSRWSLMPIVMWLPDELLVVEPALQVGFDDVEKRRDIKIAWRIQPVFANVLDFSLDKRRNSIGLARPGHALGQNRISDRFECLGD